MKQYPAFVEVATVNGRPGYYIEGNRLTSFPDQFTDDAIEIASLWEDGQANYHRVHMLREWLRENVQHGHNLPVAHLNSMEKCKNWLETIICAEFNDNLFADRKEEELQRLEGLFR